MFNYNRNLRRVSGVTQIFLIINVVVFLLMTISGGSTNSQVLLEFGAMEDSLVRAGEYDRFIKAQFLHIGLLHLFMNMSFLISVGPMIERIYGKSKFFIIYLLSGIMGNLLTFAFAHPGSVSAGASTSLYGLLGVLLGFTIFYRSSSILTNLGNAYKSVVVINLIYSLAIPGISVTGHLGGLIGGFLLSVIFRPFAIRGNKKSIRFVCFTIFLLLGFFLFKKGMGAL